MDSKQIWIQREINIRKKKGCYIITKEVLDIKGNDIKKIKTEQVNL